MKFDQTVNRKGTYCTQWDFVQDRFGVEGLLPFTISDTDFSVPESVLKAIKKRSEHPIFGYTRWQHQDFYDAVNGWYQKRFHLNLPKDSLVYSPSVIFSIALLIEILSEEGDGILYHTPAYDAFYGMIGQSKRVGIESQLLYHENQYTIDWEDMEEKLRLPEVKLFLLCSPHNPTGRVWTEWELQKIITLCQKYDVFMISDEIHMDIVRKGFRHIPLLQFIEKNLAIVTSGSKTFNFPGLIFSYCIIPDKHLREKFLTGLKQKYGLSSVSTLGLEATMAAYNESSHWVDELTDYIDKNREYVTKRLQNELSGASVVESEATYLMWIDFSNFPLSMEDIQERLIQVGKLAIMSGKVYGGNGDSFLRLNIGCPRSKLIEGMDRMILALQTST
ncbi:MalY/PatB family protein [Streptococcus cameli]